MEDEGKMEMNYISSERDCIISLKDEGRQNF